MPITSIQPLPSDRGDKPPFRALRNLILSDVPIRDWSSVDSLASHLPYLTSLRIGTSASLDDGDQETPRPPPPLSENLFGDDILDRPILIAKLPSLEVLNSSRITPDERRNAEMSYVREVSQLASGSGAKTSWGRYAELKERHGMSSVETPKVVRSDLRSKMISEYRC